MNSRKRKINVDKGETSKITKFFLQTTNSVQNLTNESGSGSESQANEESRPPVPVSLLPPLASSETESLAKNDAPNSSCPVSNVSTEPETSQINFYENRKSNTVRKPVNQSTFLKWKIAHPWLEMDSETNLMYCNVCRGFARAEDTGFVSGCQPKRVETVSKHSISGTHEKACLDKAAKEKPQSTPLVVSISAMDAKQKKNMEILFNTSYLIATENYAFDDFPILCSLQKKNGLQIGESYMNYKAAIQFVNYTADSFREELKESLRNADYISLIADGSTDRSTISSEIVYLYYLKGSEVKCSFIGLRENNEEDAPGIKSTIVSLVSEYVPDWSKKLVAVGFDGAPVNMGHVSGVATQLQDDCKQLVIVHCLAHRLELAVADALKHIPYVDTVEDVLKGIFSYYHHSAKRTRELNDISDLLDETVLRHVGVHGIRWLQSRNRAIKVFLNNFPAVVMHMENTGAVDEDRRLAAKIKGYLKQMKSLRFLKFIFFFEDVTNVLKRLSELFQKKFLTVSDVQVALTSTKSKISDLIVNSGMSLTKLEEDLITVNGGHCSYKNIELKNNINDLSSFSEDRRILCQNIIHTLEDRCETIEHNNVLQHWYLFDTGSIYGKDINDLIQSLKLFTEALPINLAIDENKVQEEYKEFVVWAQTKATLPCQVAWQRFLSETDSSELYNNIRKILKFLLILPLSTAECERGFSQQNLIRTDSRNRLSTKVVDDLLMIKLNGPKLSDFNPSKSIELWWSDVAPGRTRRINL